MRSDELPFRHPWMEGSLRHYADVIVGGTPSTLIPSYWDGNVPWMVSGDVHRRIVDDVPGRISAKGLASSNATLVEPEAVAIALAGQGKTRGTAALTVAPLSANQSVALIKPTDGRLSARFLFQSLIPRYEELRSRSMGGGRAGLTKALLDALPIQIPTRREQDAIVRILETVDDVIGQTEALIAKTQQIKAGLMHDVFTRGVLPNGAMRPKREDSPSLYKRSALGWIPKEWTEGGIESYLVRSNGLKAGPFGSALTKAVYVGSGYRVYGQEQVLAGTLSEGAYYVPLSKWVQLNAFAVAAGDLLMTLVGVGTIGRTLIVRDPFEPGLINPRIVRMRPEKAFCSAEFLGHLISWPLVRSQFNRFATGGTMPVLNLSIIRQVRVPIVPFPEQQQISARVDACIARLEQERAAACKLRELRRGLMHDLLTGTVQVPISEEQPLAAGV